MQHLPFYSLEDLDRSRSEMEAFRKERAYPDITLTGEKIHNAFCVVDPDNSCRWDEVPEIVKMKYDDLAKELNARFTFGESEDKPITAIKCPSCGQMLTDLKNHPCLR